MSELDKYISIYIKTDLCQTYLRQLKYFNVLYDKKFRI